MYFDLATNTATIDFTHPSEMDWTPQTFLHEVIEVVETAVSRTMHKHWELHVTPDWLRYLETDFYPFATYSQMSLRRRLLECPHIKVVDTLVGCKGIFVGILKSYGEIR